MARESEIKKQNKTKRIFQVQCRMQIELAFVDTSCTLDILHTVHVC